MKRVLRILSIAFFALAALCFAATNLVSAELLAPLSYAAAAFGLIAIFCNFVIRPKEDKKDEK